MTLCRDVVTTYDVHRLVSSWAVWVRAAEMTYVTTTTYVSHTMAAEMTYVTKTTHVSHMMAAEMTYATKTTHVSHMISCCLSYRWLTDTAAETQWRLSHGIPRVYLYGGIQYSNTQSTKWSVPINPQNLGSCYPNQCQQMTLNTDLLKYAILSWAAFDLP